MALYKGFSSIFYGSCCKDGTNDDGSDKGVTLKTTDMQTVNTDLITYIFTSPEERIMLPNFGTNIPNLLFEPLDDVLLATISDEIQRAVASDPRVNLIDLNITPDYDANAATAIVTLLYVELNMTGNLVINLQFEQ